MINRRAAGRRGAAYCPPLLSALGWLALVLVAVAPGAGARSSTVPVAAPFRSPQLSTPLGVEPWRGVEFPHLLISMGPRDGRVTPPTKSTGLQGNASWDPDGLLPPSILPAERRAAVESILRAEATEARLRAWEDAARFQPQPDTVHILVLRVDFLEDGAAHKSTGNGRFDLRRDDEARAAAVDPPPHDRNYFASHMEALSRYYRVMSGGAIEIAYDVYPAENDSAYHLPDTRKYGPWIFSNSNPDVLQHAIDLVSDGLAVADTTDPAIDFSRYESFLLFHAGPDFQGDINGDTPWDIPSFNLYVQDPFMVQDSTVAINLVMVVPETVSQDGFLGALNGVVTHEFGHQLGFLDLYDVRNGLPVVGAYSLMDSGENLYGLVADPADSTSFLPVRGALPGSLDPWHKAVFFPSGVDLRYPEQYLLADSSRFSLEMPAVEISDQILYVPLNLSEYLLLENRAFDLNGDSTVVLRADPETGVILGPEPDSSDVGDTYGYREYDFLLPGEGIIMWHVDQQAILAGLSVPFGGINIFFSRPGVAVVEADGIRDIGTASSEFLGGPYDPFFRGGYDCLGPGTIPSSDTNDGTPTGLTICVQDSLGLEMTVQVETGAAPPGWPVVFTGDPDDQEVLVMDLVDPPGAEVLAVGERVIMVYLADGTGLAAPGSSVFWVAPAPIEGGLSARAAFPWDPGGGEPAPLIAAVARGSLHCLTAEGEVGLVWPETQGSDPAVTSPAVVSEDAVLVGCADGAVREITTAADQPVRTVFQVANAPIRRVAAGRLHEEGAESAMTLIWAAEGGEVGALRWIPGDPADPQIIFRETSPGSGGSPREPVSILALPDAGRGPRYLFAWLDGSLEWRGWDGRLLDGWPVTFGEGIAGLPIVCDADGDGVLETVVASTSGMLHCLDFQGRDEYLWPRRVWSEDWTDPPAQVAGPRAIDVNGDGSPEILLHRSDGLLLAVDGRGEAAPSWPRALGAPGTSGPFWSPVSPGYTARLVLASSYGTTPEGHEETALSPLRVPTAVAEGPGFFPVAGVDVARSGVYPFSWMPAPIEAPGTLAEETVRIYPNPLRGDVATVRFVLGRQARVLLDAYDLSGRRVASLEAAGQAGASGNHVPWDLSALAPGLYQIRFRVQGEGFEHQLFQKLAIVR